MSSSSTFPLAEELRPFVLLGGLNAVDLWPSVNVVILSYALLVFAPRWRWTPTLTLITPVFQSVIYAGSILSLMLFGNDDAAPDATTLEGVVTLFKDPNIVFVGWIHYIVFDLLVARMEVLDSIQRGASITVHILVVIPCMIGTFMLGPFGFLAYMMLRQIFLPETPTEQADAPKMKIL